MQPLIRAATTSGVAAALAVRASREVSSRQPHAGARLAQPDRVPLEDVGATPGDVRPPSDLVAQADEIAAQLKVGARKQGLDSGGLGGDAERWGRLRLAGTRPPGRPRRF